MGFAHRNALRPGGHSPPYEIGDMKKPIPAALSFAISVAMVFAVRCSALAQTAASKGASGLFARDNLVAWCIVPFDSKKRGPVERVAMLERLGFRRYAYDWRAEHLPTFDAEEAELQKH